MYKSKEISKQKMYGEQIGVIEELIELKILTSEAKNYRNKYFAVYDIETIETKSDVSDTFHTEYKQRLKLITIAISSNIENYKPKVRVRDDMNPASEEKIIEQFINELYDIYNHMYIPQYIYDSISRLKCLIKEQV